MSFGIGSVRIQIKFLFVAFMTLLLFTDTTGLMIYGYIFSMVHEAGHLLMMAYFRNPPEEIIFEIYGIRIVKQDRLIWYQEAAVLLAGPITNLAIGMLIWWLSGRPNILTAYNLVLGILNLLPIAGLDGGQLASLLLGRWLGPAGEKVAAAVSILLLAPLIAAGFYVFIGGEGNITLLLVVLFLLVTLWNWWSKLE